MARTLRVAMLGPYPIDRSRVRGGTEAVTANLVAALDVLPDIEVEVVTMVRGGRFNHRVEPRGRSGAVHFLECSGLPAMTTGGTIWRARARVILSRLRPDIVHCQRVDYAYFANPFGLFPAIVTVHGLQARECQLLRPSLANWIRSRWMTHVEQSTFRRSEHLIIQNNYTKRFLEGKTKAALHVIDNPVPDEYFDLKRSPLENRVLVVGRVEPRKGTLAVLEALAVLKSSGVDFQAHFVGGHPNSAYFSRCAAFASDNQLGPRVSFVGRVPEELLLREYAEAALLLMGSVEETAPMVIAQAMAAGVPVVATSAGGIAEMVTDDQSGYVVPIGDSGGLASAAGRILCDYELGHRLGERAKNAAIRRFRSRHVALANLELYSEIVHRT